VPQTDRDRRLQPVVNVEAVGDGSTDALAVGLTVTVIGAPPVKRALAYQWEAFHSHPEPLRHERLEAPSAPHERYPDRSCDQQQRAAGEIAEHAARGQKKDATSRDGRCARGSDAAASNRHNSSAPSSPSRGIQMTSNFSRVTVSVKLGRRPSSAAER